MMSKKRIPGYFAWLIPLILILVLMTGSVVSAGPLAQITGTSVFINEIHYDNAGTDTGEAIEIAGPAGTDLTGWTLVLYNGNGGAAYNTTSLSAVIADQQSGFGTVFVSYPTNGIQNGAPDGIALVDAGSAVVQFLSYEGSFTAVGGPADGMTSTDIGVDEPGTTPVGDSLQLVGVGGVYEDFSWAAAQPNTFGGVNTGQIFGLPPTSTPTPIGPTPTPLPPTPTPTPLPPTPTPTPTPVPLFVPIYDIQGSGQFSPYVGMTVTTSGVVTLITDNGRDMWIQDPVGDGDPATSDGIFVDDRDRLSPMPMVGDVISITAEVEEQQFGAALPRTRLDSFSGFTATILSSGNPLPAPVPLTDLPDEVIADGINFWEPLEGMLVSVSNAPVVAATSRFGEFGMLAKDDAKPGSGFYPQIQQILLRDLGNENVDYNPERILVDDASLSDAIQVIPGDRVRSLVGVVDYSFGAYKLQPASFDIKYHKLPKMPVSKRSGPDGNVVITTYNIENLFDLIDNPDKDDGSSTPTATELDMQLTKLALSIEVELELPEIIVVQETENQDILQVLGDRVNAAAGTAYVATSFETSDGRGIEAGFLWDADRVSLLNAFQLDDTIVPGVSAAFGPGSPSPGREPIVGVFDIHGYTVTIVGNHFKSKGGDDPLFGVNWPPIRITEVQRKAQAQVVRDYVNLLFNADPDALVMVAGDLNDFQFSEPGEGPDNPVAIVAGGPGEVPLTNLLDLEKAAETYTFVFDGNSQVLDHMLVSPALYDMVVGADILHFNAGYPASADADVTNTLRAADHDPLEGRFKFK